jgi:hypothetical protein
MAVKSIFSLASVPSKSNTMAFHDVWWIVKVPCVL